MLNIPKVVFLAQLDSDHAKAVTLIRLLTKICPTTRIKRRSHACQSTPHLFALFFYQLSDFVLVNVHRSVGLKTTTSTRHDTSLTVNKLSIQRLSNFCWSWQPFADPVDAKCPAVMVTCLVFWKQLHVIINQRVVLLLTNVGGIVVKACRFALELSPRYYFYYSCWVTLN